MDSTKLYVWVTIAVGTGSDRIFSKIKNRLPGIENRNEMEILEDLNKRRYNASILITTKDPADIAQIDNIVEQIKDISSVLSVNVYCPMQ